jgi:hypothetical protein
MWRVSWIKKKWMEDFKLSIKEKLFIDLLIYLSFDHKKNS